MIHLKKWKEALPECTTKLSKETIHKQYKEDQSYLLQASLIEKLSFCIVEIYC